MPDIGNTSLTGASVRQINGVMRGSVFTMPEDGTIVSITAHIEDAATGDSFRAAIYDADTLTAATLVDQSSVRTDISTQGNYVFSGFAGASLTAGTVIFIGVGSNSAAGANVYHDTGTGYNLTITDINSLPTPVDLDATVDLRLIATYLTYTTAGGATVTVVVGNPQRNRRHSGRY